ncbi:MAG: hypothetical protein V4819_14520 [Verrucomicrobiota bacterium]
MIGLPQTLFWGMWFLRDALPGADHISDESIITYVFASARRLVGIHDRQVLQLRNAGLVKGRVQVARRVVEKLELEKLPMKRRELSRLFNTQKKERILPVLVVLVESRILCRSDSGAYELGPVELDEAAEMLFEASGEKVGSKW